MKTCTINVTQECIDAANAALCPVGSGQICYVCPVAQAVFRATGKLYKAYEHKVALADAYWPGYYYPEGVAEKIYKYDQTNEMEPFSFEMELPE